MNTITRLGLLVVISASLGAKQVAAFDMDAVKQIAHGTAYIAVGAAAMAFVAKLVKEQYKGIKNCKDCKKLKSEGFFPLENHLKYHHDLDLDIIFGAHSCGFGILALCAGTQIISLDKADYSMFLKQ